MQIRKSETYCGTSGDRQGSENATPTSNSSSPHDFGAFQFSNENINTFQQESYFSSYPSKPSPRNSFGPVNPQRQFGQKRMLNCLNEVQNLPSFANFNEISTSYFKYN